MRYIHVFLCLCFLIVPASVHAGEGYMLLKPSQISDRIMDKSGMRRAVFIYASWCPYCRRAMPSLIALGQNHPGAIIAISVDKKPQDLVRYMEREKYNPPFELIVWDRRESLTSQMGRFGIELSDGVPFTALLDETGQVTKQGFLKADEIASYIERGEI